MPTFSAKLGGSGNMSGGLAASRKRWAQRVERALKATGKALLEESLKIVPRDTFSLHDSSIVRQEHSGFDTVVIVGYGRLGYVVTDILSNREGILVTRVPYDYAVYVHEGGPNMYSPHPPGEDKFLEKPLQNVSHLHAVFMAAL